MKKVQVTFSIPKETNHLLNWLVGRRKMGAFVAQVLTSALEEKMKELKKAYRDAQKDSDRKDVIGAWQNIEVEDWEY